ncbi:hypothetical protein HKX17_11995 [Sulfitobacter sp. KE34]|uniref:TnsA endonuclease N-terminal domain-containing protein n=1 Tax=Sulfitobacter faviae TaxID=1775881 RepID=A0AAX3LQQ6_9RHOB|nr:MULTISPECIES: hypothetical protein [Sulfitobacter]MDF3350874.1 hypothetical protein [Sulfitobacter sp. KE12]MDF3354546.1 hypothetical protein [Sulfitobacter sp. KE27]MDF3358194.1 hypothetical protein [Sulfitobacter sp. KE33]MDF3361260.1 hypothetical protein [Sulfitobacter sp. Ks41]MDF3365618.1 hypothetical protein [Sulfitobacter sp. Ks34]
MDYPNTAGTFQLPATSIAERQPPVSSRGHANGQLVVGRHGARRGLHVESDLEFKWASILDADPDVVYLREQVRVEWADGSKTRIHFFDFVATFSSCKSIAMIVKPSHRANKPKFQSEVQLLARSAVQSGFVDEVRVLTEASLDDARVRNARFLRSVREIDVVADTNARAVAAQLLGYVSLADLTAKIGLGGRGFRALVRLIGEGVLSCVTHELICPSTLVQGGKWNENA